MALISKKPVTERETASYKLDRSTIELVRFYSEFIGSPQEHVVNEALRYIFHKDKDFSAWLKANGNPNLFPAAEPGEGPAKRKAQSMAAGPGATAVLGGNK